MKYVLLTLTVLTLAGTTAGYKAAQAATRIVTAPATTGTTTHGFCHQEWYCGPYGCQIITICN